MRSSLGILSTAFLFCLVSPARATNFTFSYTAPTQCGNISISWAGGTPPFQLTLTRIFGTPYVVDIPASSYTNGEGSFVTQVPFEQKKTMLITMSDANGFSTGGTSEVLTVGSPTSSASCNTTDPGVDFFFDADPQILQCSPYHFSNYINAVPPITIVGMIPDGDAFILNPPASATEFAWTVDVAAGTSVLFTMTDSKGRIGGTTQVSVVGVSDDSSCLTGNAPQTLEVFPTPTTLGSSGGGSTTSAGPTSSNSAAPDSDESSHSGVSGGAIAGAIIGVLLAVAVAASLVWFFWWRKRGSGNAYGGTALPYRSRRNPNVDLLPETTEGAAPVISPYPFYHADTAEGVPDAPWSSSNLLRESSQFDAQSSYVMANPFSIASSSRPGSEVGLPYAASLRGGGSEAGASTLSPSQRKAAMAGLTTYKPARFIVHTDAEDDNLPPQEDEVVELPPQYSERHLKTRPSTIAEETSSGYSVPLASSSTSSPSRAAPPPLPQPLVAPQGAPSTSASVLDRVDQGASNRLQQPMKPSSPVTPSGAYGQSFLP